MLDFIALRTFFFPLFILSFSFFSPLISRSLSEDLLTKLSLREKISQLFMIAVYPSDSEKMKETVKLLEEYPPGGIIFFQGTVEGQRKLVTELQQKSRYPLLVGQDNEWGLSLRLSDGLRFPRNLTLGAIRDVDWIYKMAEEVAEQCLGVGVHVNFAPVADVNNNPDNPVISDRSFGENVSQVVTKSLLYMKGLQDRGVMACAKHFPGHGDTSLDSHLLLPMISKSFASLEELELLPFQAMVREGVSSVMTGHLLFPFISREPASLSQFWIQDVLRGRMHFDGLIFTDSQDMKSVSSEPGEAAILALQAGNDMILYPKDFRGSVRRIERAVAEGLIREEEIDEHVLRILRAKERVGLYRSRIPPPKDFFSAKGKALKKELFYRALTLVEKKEGVLPLKKNNKMAFVQIGRDLAMKNSLEPVDISEEERENMPLPPFFSALASDYSPDYFFLPKRAGEKEWKRLAETLSSYDAVIIGVYEMNKFSRKHYGIEPSTPEFLALLQQKKIKLYAALFGSPYALRNFSGYDVLIMAYENDEDAQKGCAEILKGSYHATGRLPVTAGERYPEGFGL